jgi:hypothetical protein
MVTRTGNFSDNTLTHYSESIGENIPIDCIGNLTREELRILTKELEFSLINIESQIEHLDKVIETKEVAINDEIHLRSIKVRTAQKIKKKFLDRVRRVRGINPVLASKFVLHFYSNELDKEYDEFMISYMSNEELQIISAELKQILRRENVIIEHYDNSISPSSENKEECKIISLKTSHSYHTKFLQRVIKEQRRRKPQKRV